MRRRGFSRWGSEGMNVNWWSAGMTLFSEILKGVHQSRSDV
jgi:hypothetical protein